MSDRKVILVTGASSGFGALGGRNAQAAADLAAHAAEQGVDLYAGFSPSWNPAAAAASPSRSATPSLNQDPDHTRANTPRSRTRLLFCLVRAPCRVYHQQTKNLLVSCSPKKLGFF